MAARAAKIQGGKVEIRKKHIEIYKITHFQNFRENFPGKTTKWLDYKGCFFFVFFLDVYNFKLK